MFVDFLYELRRRGLKVGAQEALSLGRALDRGLHDDTLDGFYDVARALCVHRAEDLDGFDRAFAHHFHGAADEALKLTEEMLEWLKDAAPRRELTEEERKLLDSLDLEEARRRLKERIADQKGRHDRGNKWIGTGGTSPHGRAGSSPSGIRLGEGEPGRRGGAIANALERKFANLRGDVTLDTRAIEQALRRLRAFAREGALDELDLEGTIDSTAKNAGELDIKLRPPRRSNVRVLLLLDVGGSMDPHAELCSRLFSAARRASNFKELRTLYFHNCIYGKVYPDTWLRRGQNLTDVLAQCDPGWRVIVVGDALMHPQELFSGGGRWTYHEDDAGDVPGVAWMQLISEHFRKSVWLNPEPEAQWYGTAATLGRLFPMYRLTLDGLSAAIQKLTGHR